MQTQASGKPPPRVGVLGQVPNFATVVVWALQEWGPNRVLKPQMILCLPWLGKTQGKGTCAVPWGDTQVGVSVACEGCSWIPSPGPGILAQPAAPWQQLEE